MRDNPEIYKNYQEELKRCKYPYYNGLLTYYYLLINGYAFVDISDDNWYTVTFCSETISKEMEDRIRKVIGNKSAFLTDISKEIRGYEEFDAVTGGEKLQREQERVIMQMLANRLEALGKNTEGLKIPKRINLIRDREGESEDPGEER